MVHHVIILVFELPSMARISLHQVIHMDINILVCFLITEGITDHDLDTFVDMYREHCEVGTNKLSILFSVIIFCILAYSSKVGLHLF